MDLKAEKDYIKTELDKLDDVHLVAAIKNMLDFGKAKIYEQGLHPMSKGAFYERNAISRKAIEEDNLITHQEARAYFKWKHAR